jgi:hypothetical protein
MPYHTPQPDRDFARARGRNNQNSTSAADLPVSKGMPVVALADCPLQAPVLDALVWIMPPSTYAVLAEIFDAPFAADWRRPTKGVRRVAPSDWDLAGRGTIRDSNCRRRKLRPDPDASYSEFRMIRISEYPRLECRR